VFSDSDPVLKRLFGKWPYPFDITAGRVSGHGRLVWQEDLRLEGDLQLDKLGGRFEQLAFAELSGEVKVRLDPQRLALQTTLHTADQAVVLEGKGVHQIASGHGQADFKLRPVVFSDSGFVLSRLLKKWPYSFDITAGRVSGHARVVWQEDLRLQGVLQSDKLGGHYNQLAMAGLSGELALEQDTSRGRGLRTSKDAQLQVDVVDVGFPVENIDMRFALATHPKTQTPIVQIKKFAAELLGGRAHTEPFVLDLGREKNALLVKLEQIGLNEIMKLEQQEGLQGSGMLDGQIPIEISSEGVVVTHGQMTARAPGGVIRYEPTAEVAELAQSNPSVGMVVEALSNFQYQVLNVISDYKRGGDLALQVRLEGKNPDWQAGQPVHLNLNVEENIPALLRSLQLSGDITERMRKHYENTP